MQNFRPSIKPNVDLGSKLKSICKNTWKKRQGKGPKHESMCSATFLTTSEKSVAEGQPGPWKMYFVDPAKNLIQPDSTWISNKETINCNKAKFIIESFLLLMQ